jgi:glutaminyl-tRNA synthetase
VSDHGSNFLRPLLAADLASGRHTAIVTRFPPEPNGYLHIGHAKAICVDFGLAAEFGGRCHLRMDDTNPLKEDGEFVSAIQRDIRWLGFDWGEHFYNASDYFPQLFDWAKLLIRDGKAYVDEQSEEEIRLRRGTVETPGVPSPWRERPAHESLDRFERMNRGEFADSAMVLRAKIDMGHPNMKMRDPVMYRIRNVAHHHVGERWRVYPLYDWAHGQSDAIEGITHSLCSLEFDVNRELYDWYLDQLPAHELKSRPRQFEFARLKLPYTVMSKRLLVALVAERHVSGWDDPRMPTLAGLRRRGYTPESIRTFVERLGVSKADSMAEVVMLENAVREDLDHRAPRVMVVLDPLEVELEGAAEDWLDAPYWPHDVPREGSRRVPISPRLFIEREDFAVEPVAGFKRLAPGRSVRLRHAGVITCTAHEVDAEGRVTRVRARLHPKGEGKAAATIHWVDASRAAPVEVRLYDSLFTVPMPGAERDFREELNRESLKVVTGYAEPSVLDTAPGTWLQFERLGFFFAEPETSTPGKPAFNRTVALKDGWASHREDARPVKAAEPRVEAPVVHTVRRLDESGRALVARGLSEDEAEALQAEPALRAWFDGVVGTGAGAKASASWVVTELPRVARDHGGLSAVRFGAEALGALVQLVESGAITHGIGKQVLQILAAEGGDAVTIVRERGLQPMTDATALEALVREVLAANPDKVAAFRGGRAGLAGFFVGQVMQKSGGRADANQVKDLVAAALAG